MSGQWASSRRRDQLPPDWPAIRRRILRRDPTCQLGYVGCSWASTEVDHIDDPLDHSDGNLRGVCKSCHRKRTQAQAKAAHQAHYARARRQPEPHPGVIR